MLTRPENYSYDRVKQMILGIPELHKRACVALLYGSGVRVSELNQIGKEDVQLTDIEGVEILRVRSVTLKKREEKDTDRFIPIYLQEESWIVEPILEIKKYCKDKLFPQHRATLFRWCVKETNINPHGFRKIRLTHLATIYKFTDQQLTKFAGWEDSRPAKAYVRLQMQDIIPMRSKP